MEPHSTLSNFPDDLDPALLERYWLGETSRAETEVVDAWLAANPVWKARYDELKRHISTDTSRNWKPLTQIEVHNTIDKVLTATGIKTDATARSISTRKKSSSRAWKYGKPFASLGLGLAAVLAVGFGWVISTSAPTPALEQTYTTGIGQRITVTLNDGTNVTLAPQSALNIPTEFGSSTRTLSLNGEAHFDVTSVDRLPFIVKTGNTHTRVLGTRFVVKHYELDRQVRVAVESGKVSFGNDYTSKNAETKENNRGISEQVEEEVILVPGQVAFSDSTGISVSIRDDLSDYTDWLHSRLTFRSVPLDEALETLTRWYGVNFNVSDSRLMESRITGSLPYGSLEDMLKTLRDLLNVSLSYERGEDGALSVTLHVVQNEPRPLRRENRFSLPTAFNR